MAAFVVPEETSPTDLAASLVKENHPSVPNFVVWDHGTDEWAPVEETDHAAASSTPLDSRKDRLGMAVVVAPGSVDQQYDSAIRALS